MLKCLTTDVLICGGGISGLIAARALINLGLTVVCLEKRKEVIEPRNQLIDNRSTALLAPSVNFLNDLGIWSRLLPKAQILKSLIICNLNLKKELVDESCKFSANELNLDYLGFNISNDILFSELKNSLKSEKKFLFLNDIVIEEIITRSKEIIALTNQQQKITAKLVVGADGKNSSLRELANIYKFGIDYIQQALVFSIKHELSHKSQSYEIYESGGPCTLVPLKTKSDNGHFSSVVLMQNQKEIKKTLTLNVEEMSGFISKRTGRILGECRIKTPVNKFPIISQISKNFIADRIALIAQSAHVMPPIGAQGLNTSIQDIKVLTKFIGLEAAGRKDFGDRQILINFEKARANQIRSKMLGIHALNKISIPGSGFALKIRKFGLNTLNNNLKARKFVMKIGMYGNLQTNV